MSIGTGQLKQMLATMFEVDQGVRMKAQRDKTATGELGVYNYLTYLIDALHNQKLKNIIQKCGFDELNALEEETQKKLWLLVQHQDEDLDFQKECLENIQFPPKEFAHLTDRVLVNEGKLQRYGTQYTMNKEGKRVLQKAEDPGQLEARRKEIGWDPLDD